MTPVKNIDIQAIGEPISFKPSYISLKTAFILILKFYFYNRLAL